MSEETSATGGRSGKNRKPKSPPDLDLSSADLREVSSEAPAQPAAETPADPAVEAPAEAEVQPAPAAVEAETPAPAAPPPSPSPSPSPSRAVPLVLGLVAGLVGGFGGGVLAPRLLPAAAPVAKPDPALGERLARAEAALSEARQREEGLRKDFAALGERLAGTGENARKGLEAAESKAAALLAPTAREIDTLRGRLGKLEGDQQGLPRELETLGARVGTLDPRLQTLENSVDALKGRLASVGAKDALALANGRMAAQSMLEDAFGAGKPYAQALDLITRTGGEASLIALVQPFAEKGAPLPAQLRQDFAALRPKPAEAAAESGLLARTKQAALSLVEIRQVGNATAKGDEGTLARIDQALARGDLTLAMETSAGFSPALAPTYAPWRARLEARIKAGEAVVRLREDARAALARAAASAR